MAKYLEIAEILKNRIEHGDYLNSPMPGERKIADEIGVSYMTARKAIRHLIDAGVIGKAEDGKAQLPKSEALYANCAFLAPAFASLQTIRWQMALDQTLNRSGRLLRSAYFVHWDDLAIAETLANFDLVFLLPKLETPPERLLRKLADSGKPVIVLESDWSERGFLSILSSPVEAIDRLLELLAEGDAPVDCFNSQPLDDIIEARLAQWEKFPHRGRCFNYPINFYGETLPHTCRVASGLLREGSWEPRAVFCTTLPAAIGLNRVFTEFGLQVGRDVKLAAVNGEDWAPYLTPSITALANADLNALVARALELLRTGCAPVCLKPARLEVLPGESTAGFHQLS